MDKFINSKKATYHHKTISDFSKTNSFVSSGLSYGYSAEEYSWLADMLFKHRSNTYTNAHIAYISFFSNREIMNQEYWNVSGIYEEYPFLKLNSIEKTSPHTFELSSRQYATIGQKSVESDVLEYINATMLENFEWGATGYDTVEFKSNHEYYKAPGFRALGFRLDMEYVSIPYENHYQYLWIWDRKTGSGSTYNPEVSLDNYRYNLTVKPWLADASNIDPDNDAIDILTDWDYYTYGSSILRMIKYQLNVNNPKYIYFEPMSQMVNYYNDEEHYVSNTYVPYLGIVGIYNNSWEEVLTGHNSTFFPQVIQDGVLEPAKVITSWELPTSAIPKSKITYNPINHLQEADDQSRIIYSVCEHMFSIFDPASPSRNSIYKVVGLDVVYEGIDIDTERNRKYSATVTTEPYFVNSPISNGELIKYTFVDYNNTPVSFDDPADFKSAPAMYLKIKASSAFIKELDRILSLKEFNTDIINTFEMEAPQDHLSNLYNSGSSYYRDFGGTVNKFFERQDDCIDNLIGDTVDGSKVGAGRHVKFWVDGVSDLSYRYTDDEMKINGLGYRCKTTVNSNGEIQSSYEDSLFFYCNNYIAEDAPLPSGAPVPVETPIEILDDKSLLSDGLRYELFRPLLKLSCINGFIKIIERNPHFELKRAADGKYEVIYNIEFPYCPGSYTERSTMDFSGSDPYKLAQILYKENYINSGSWEIADERCEDRYDKTNDRYAPYGDDSFVYTNALFEYDTVEDNVTTNSFKKNGRITSADGKLGELILYPKSLIYSVNRDKLRLLSLIKPKANGYERYGTYIINLVPSSSGPADMKLISIADNQQWKFDIDKFSSYIGREVPTYIFEINASTLFEDYLNYQKHYSGIPNMKRWLYTNFSGYAHMVSLPSIEEANNITSEEIITLDKVNWLTSKQSESDIIIEIWDQLS